MPQLQPQRFGVSVFFPIKCLYENSMGVPMVLIPVCLWGPCTNRLLLFASFR